MRPTIKPAVSRRFLDELMNRKGQIRCATMACKECSCQVTNYNHLSDAHCCKVGVFVEEMKKRCVVIEDGNKDEAIG